MDKVLPFTYAPIPSTDEIENTEYTKPTTIKAKKRNHFKRICLIVIALSTVLISFALWMSLRGSHRNDLPPETCGNTTAEALSLGCSFDVIAFAWLPARCYDSELVTQFLAIKDWQWYLDAEGQQTANKASVIAASFDEVYVSQEYHMYHCTYMWRKMHRAILAEAPLDGYIGDLHHTTHCEMQILDQSKAMDDISTTVYKKYVNCPWEQTPQGRWGWYRVINGRRVHRNP